MEYTNNPIIKHKAGLLNFAEELGNISRACKIMGVPRDTFYRYQEMDEWMEYYNNDRTHQGKICCGRTLIDSKSIWAEKNLTQI